MCLTIGCKSTLSGYIGYNVSYVKTNSSLSTFSTRGHTNIINSQVINCLPNNAFMVFLDNNGLLFCFLPFLRTEIATQNNAHSHIGQLCEILYKYLWLKCWIRCKIGLLKCLIAYYDISTGFLLCITDGWMDGCTSGQRPYIACVLEKSTNAGLSLLWDPGMLLDSRLWADSSPSPRRPQPDAI